ncbi:hypothetical protein PRIPAC_82883, partial [Pristionchus pacificus]|uniref:Uncharacterized protein n=1 Tax=Pristionchus pacificus TaxID=54126 RepID=A0A2A6BHE7_PRIPA
RGADYADEKDEEEGEEIDWDRRSMEAEMEECQQPRCIKRRKLYEDLALLEEEQALRRATKVR